MTAAVRAYAIGAIVDGTTLLGAATTNDGPGGRIAYEDIVANSSPTSSIILVSTLPNVPINDGRLIVCKANGMMRATGPMGLDVVIQQDGSDVGRRYHYVHASGTDCPFSVEFQVHAPSAGDHDYTLHIGISGAGGFDVNLEASSTTPALFAIDDMGPDF